MTVFQENLEAYIELLYEGQDDMSEKIKGTQIILQVPTEPVRWNEPARLIIVSRPYIFSCCGSVL